MLIDLIGVAPRGLQNLLGTHGCNPSQSWLGFPYMMLITSGACSPSRQKFMRGCG
jgi:hypothetical protein